MYQIHLILYQFHQYQKKITLPFLFHYLLYLNVFIIFISHYLKQLNQVIINRERFNLKLHCIHEIDIL